MRSTAILAWAFLALTTVIATAQEVSPNPPAVVEPAVPSVSQAQATTTRRETVRQAGRDGADSVPTALLPHNLSPWGMFMNADIVVKAVMIGLAFASLVTWTVWLAKTLELFFARLRTQRAVSRIVHARTLQDAGAALAMGGGAASLFVQAARQEVDLTAPVLDHAGGDGLKERVASRLSRIEAQATRRMTRGTGLLATIGSTAPFVGLFGTVWGIMNAFIGISEAQTTNLAVVAPGIAEALLATALGLVAAIPAVVIYNVFARAIAGYRQVLADAAAGVERLVSRDLDYRAVPARSMAAE
ncbi:tonB-system energizer ExbB [Mesorhizobium sp. 8]|uniref:tonB-system energizer ExbB n=1 Tax=Mesorhizobium sp. 8 TaxID=2584466 RepID=UPI001122996C|nr:tonB-system energizer ExbB [Mesorhizobium sp. 8]QDC00758.1 tonB-system energizer ExbB [Mesorhizobium sp. 8]